MRDVIAPASRVGASPRSIEAETNITPAGRTLTSDTPVARSLPSSRPRPCRRPAARRRPVPTSHDLHRKIGNRGDVHLRGGCIVRRLGIERVAGDGRRRRYRAGSDGPGDHGDRDLRARIEASEIRREVSIGEAGRALRRDRGTEGDAGGSGIVTVT